MHRDFLVSGDTFRLAITRADTTLGANLNYADFKVTLMTESQQKSFPVSWEELHRTSKALAWRLLELGPFEGIVAVTRGGLVPAAIVARELEIRLIETACISSYHGNDQGELAVLKDAPSAGDGTGWLIVDDLVDTGETARALRTMMHHRTQRPCGLSCINQIIDNQPACTITRAWRVFQDSQFTLVIAVI